MHELKFLWNNAYRMIEMHNIVYCFVKYHITLEEKSKTYFLLKMYSNDGETDLYLGDHNLYGSQSICYIQIFTFKDCYKVPP